MKIESKNYKCDIVQDCLGWNLRFYDLKGNSKDIVSVDEWIQAHSEKYNPLFVSVDTLSDLRELVDQTYRLIEESFDFNSKNYYVLTDLIYMSKSWDSWFEGAKVGKLKYGRPWRAKNNLILNGPEEFNPVQGEFRVNVR